jgi:hypothetical protein
MADSETLHFKIGLSRSSNKKHPKFKIFLNDVEYVSNQVKYDSEQTEYFEFDAAVVEGDCNLVIEFLNKSKLDTVLDSNGTIVEDLLLNIDSIEIDEIDLGPLLWTASNYKPNYPQFYKDKILESGGNLPELVDNCVNLGWNGKWALPFTSPFYIWLLENI